MSESMDRAREAIAEWQRAAARHRSALANAHEETLTYLNVLAAITPYEQAGVGEQAEEDQTRWKAARAAHDAAALRVSQAQAEVEAAEQAAGVAADASGYNVAIDRARNYRDS